MPASTLILDAGIQKLRTDHGKASKATRSAAEALAEADQAAQGARGLCFEWMSSRLNPDAEFFALREAAGVKSLAYTTLLDEVRAAQTLEMRALHTELDHLAAAVHALQSKVGITITGTPIAGAASNNDTAPPTTA